MVDAKVIIVGGGPAGSTCAWKLRELGVESLILEKKSFPRYKLCAGWISPKVFRLLNSSVDEYPHTKVLHKTYHFHYNRYRLPVRTRQYVIRRQEFDQWLLERSGADVEKHQVTYIEKTDKGFIIDDKYRCEYLIGAGGTGCPVYNTLFKPVAPRPNDKHITTLEEEFEYDYTDTRAHFWYLDNKFGGYAWYTPKAEGVLTVGIGGFLSSLKRKNENIRYHWNLLTEKLDRLSMVKKREYKPKGWTYYLRSTDQSYQLDNAYLIGDAAGLATVDMGEGIRPAVQSAILAAESIATNRAYVTTAIGKYSIRDVLFPGA